MILKRISILLKGIKMQKQEIFDFLFGKRLIRVKDLKKCNNDFIKSKITIEATGVGSRNFLKVKQM